MSFSTKINFYRRNLMRNITTIVVKDTNPATVDIKKISSSPRILISRPNNRLGNQILITPLIQELIKIFPDCRIDLFVRGNLSSILFETYPNIDRIIKLPNKPFKELRAYMGVWAKLRRKSYDIIINVSNDSSSGRLSTRLAKSKIKIFGNDYHLENTYSDYYHIAKKPVYNLRHFLKKAGFKIEECKISDLNLNLSQQELENGRKVLDSLVDPQKKTICIYTFATGNKCYSKEWWKEVHTAIKEKYGSEYNILEVLPKENVSQIDFVEPSYYSVDLREMTAVIANSAVFIGADSGVMHLASAGGAPTLGLFSVTSMQMYGPYNHKSIAFDTNTKNINNLMEEISRILENS